MILYPKQELINNVIIIINCNNNLYSMWVILESNICNPNFPTWEDDKNSSCTTYIKSGWCMSSGEYGPEWNFNGGLFRTFSSQNYSALNCPECGCQGMYHADVWV